MAVHQLRATSSTVRVGTIDAAHPAVLTIDAGDEVVFETWQHWGDGITPHSTIEDVLQFRKEFEGRGPHSMTGPVAIRGAEPGMSLKVEILELIPRSHGWNLFLPGRFGCGLLHEDFPEGSLRHFFLDVQRMTTQFSDSVTLPLRPFLGIMGVAPKTAQPRLSMAPGDFGGNLDFGGLVVGSTLWLPVWAPGAGFYVGDAHACQGNGEVNLTAIETAMEVARLRLSLSEKEIAWPRAEDDRYFMSLACDLHLHEAARIAVREMVSLLQTEKGLSAEDAYALCSVAADVGVTQLVNGNVGAHVKVPKAIFRN